MLGTCWEVLNGVGVDGVGVIFPFFYAFFVFLRNFSLFFAFLRFSSLFSSSPRGQGQTTAKFTAKKGEFHSDPVCTDPVQTSRTWGRMQMESDGVDRILTGDGDRDRGGSNLRNLDQGQKRYPKELL